MKFFNIARFDGLASPVNDLEPSFKRNRCNLAFYELSIADMLSYIPLFKEYH